MFVRKRERFPPCPLDRAGMMIETRFAQGLEAGIHPTRGASGKELLLFPDRAELVNEHSALRLGAMATHGFCCVAANRCA